MQLTWPYRGNLCESAFTSEGQGFDVSMTADQFSFL